MFWRRARTPTLLQMEAVECGAAALGIVLGYHGRFVPLAELRQRCGVSRDGNKASQIVQAARSYGLEARGLTRELESLTALKAPFVVHWQFNHFLVVEGITRQGVHVNDPMAGHRKIPLAEFSEGYTGVVLEFVPGPEFRKAGRPPRLLPALLGRLRGYWASLIAALLAGLLLVLPGLAIPVFTGIYIDDILVKGTTSWLRPLLAVMTVTILMQLVLLLLEKTCLRRLMLALTAQLSARFYWHLLRLPLLFYGQRYSGEIAYRLYLNQKLATVLTGKLADAVIGLVRMGLYLVILSCFSLVLTGIGVVCAILNFVVLRALGPRRVEASLRMVQGQGKAAAAGLAGLQGIETLKAAGMETGYFAKWCGYYSKAEMAHQELEATTLALGVLPAMLEWLALSLVLGIGGLQVMAGAMSLGMLVAFQSLMHQFLEPVAELTRLSGTLQELRADVQRLDDVLDQPADRGDGCKDNPITNHQSPITNLEVRNLSFGYARLGPPLIQDFNLQLSPGRRVALVGRSGSGKSTLARLILGLHEPWSGEILLDQRPRKTIPEPVLARSLGFVDQDLMLFEGTVRENLTLWDRAIPEEALLRACRDAGLDDLVVSLPGGLDAVLQEDGANLSGGQRQRLEIARALVNRPMVLVLDEATSALDPETEAVVLENLRSRGCACLIVAHRLSTIRDCDEIVVLDNGRVVERGTHEDLWALQGHYAQLIQTASDDETES